MRVVVTTSTIPTREEAVVEMIHSIKTGTYIPDEIYVNLPKWYPRFRRSPDPNLKQKLESLGVKVSECDDYGVLTKSLPILDVETDPETLIIIIDDDMIYQPRVIEGLVKAYEEFKCPVGYSGLAYPETVLRMFGKFGYRLFQGHGAHAEMMECAFGYAFPRKAMDGFWKFPPMKEDSERWVYLSDDYLYSKHFERMGLPKRVACYPWAGRVGDDWSTIWTQKQSSQTHALSRDENNLENFFRAGLKLKLINPT